MTKKIKCLSITLFSIFIFYPISTHGGMIKDVYDILNDIQKQLTQRYDNKVDEYSRNLENWVRFSPVSKSIKPMEILLRPLDRLNLEDGWASGVKNPGVYYDLVYVTGPGGYEILRAENGVSWYLKGLANFESILYREIRDAPYFSQIHNKTGYPDLFYSHMSNAPPVGTVYFVKTRENNVTKIQILGYINEYYGSQVIARNMKLKIETFPIVSDPPKPKPPIELSNYILEKINRLLN
ncbi:hypothetical protein [uncultured Desulfosarcina sp.]|uniref:hypothetical protein n=1 Tax=uncultured Desulfosarcina sp. TaxID=218289 RepID=UPI0029C7A2D3|nr:hypothetical protein [uncultured Desulfosarcina sp.]